MRSWVRGGSGDRNQEERTTQTEDYTETIKNHQRSLQTSPERKGEEGNTEIEPARKYGFKITDNNWKTE